MATAIAPPTPARLAAVLGRAADIYAPDFSDQPDPFGWSDAQVAEYDAAHAAPALEVVPKRSLRERIGGVDLILETIEALDDEALTDDVRDELSRQLITELAGTRAKVDATSAVLAMLEGLEAAANREIERLTIRAKRFARQQERLTDYVLATLDASQLTRIEGDTSTLARRPNPAKVEITEIAAIPREYLRHKPAPPPEPDKTAIARDLKKERPVPGACLAPKTYRLVRS